MTTKKEVLKDVPFDEDQIESEDKIKTIRLDKDLHKTLMSMVKKSNGRLRIGGLANQLIRLGVEQARKAGGITINI